MAFNSSTRQTHAAGTLPSSHPQEPQRRVHGAHVTLTVQDRRGLTREPRLNLHKAFRVSKAAFREAAQ